VDRVRKDTKGGERGWTFIEATLALVLVSVLVLGLAVVMLAMRETVDRDLSIRVMDQYGNDVMKHFEYILGNADLFVPIASQSSGTMDHFEVHYEDPFGKDPTTVHRYRASRTEGVIRDNARLDPQFPPEPVRRGKPFGVLNRGESFVITQFTARGYEERENSILFYEGAIRVTLGLRYIREGGRNEPDYHMDKSYSTLCVLKNSFIQNDF
jgi:hypothetical protein